MQGSEPIHESDRQKPASALKRAYEVPALQLLGHMAQVTQKTQPHPDFWSWHGRHSRW